MLFVTCSPLPRDSSGPNLSGIALATKCSVHLQDFTCQLVYLPVLLQYLFGYTVCKLWELKFILEVCNIGKCGKSLTEVSVRPLFFLLPLGPQGSNWTMLTVQLQQEDILGTWYIDREDCNLVGEQEKRRLQMREEMSIQISLLQHAVSEQQHEKSGHGFQMYWQPKVEHRVGCHIGTFRNANSQPAYKSKICPHSQGLRNYEILGFLPQFSTATTIFD